MPASAYISMIKGVPKVWVVCPECDNRVMLPSDDNGERTDASRECVCDDCGEVITIRDGPPIPRP